jgi:hypothetical protein
MSAREYFSLRYAVPGFTFILIIVGMNFLPIFFFLRRMGTPEAFGVILSFLSLFAGSAIGFLVSQVYYWYYHWKRIYAKVLVRQEGLMKEKLGWKVDAPKGREKDVMMSAVLDYRVLWEKDDRYWGYFQRRWDIYHTLSSTLVSFVLGLLVGSVTRVIVECIFAMKESIWKPWQFQTLTTEAKIDVLLMAFTVISAVALALFIWRGKRQVFNEYDKVLDLLIRSSTPEFKASLQEAFRDFFNEQTSDKNIHC